MVGLFELKFVKQRLMVLRYVHVKFDGKGYCY